MSDEVELSAPSPGIEHNFFRGSLVARSRLALPLSQHPAFGALPRGGPTPSAHLDSCIALYDDKIFRGSGAHAARRKRASVTIAMKSSMHLPELI